MIERKVAETVIRLSNGYPIITITGPRQSGKTTLARATFPDKPYVSLEDPDARVFADSDPRAFFARFPDGAILDEVQRCPELFSYLQTIVDLDGRTGLYVLTGSQQFGLLSQISQSLAGRVGLVQLLPFSYGELAGAGKACTAIEDTLYTGSYPPLYDRTVSPADWYPGYVLTYLERDLHQLVNVRDMKTFQLFLRMCAARTGQLINLSSLANDCGITHNTAKAWLSVLEASYLIFFLQPHHRNFSKRMTKSAKLYFYDTGLVCWLLGIQDAAQVLSHSLRGAIFETWVVAELIKGRFNRGLTSNLFFWRDSAGDEVDLIIEKGEQLFPIEIKSGMTITADYFKALRKWESIAGGIGGFPRLVYGGNESQQRTDTDIVAWKEINGLAGAI